MQKLKSIWNDSGVIVVFCVLNFVIGVILGNVMGSIHTNERILNKKEWPCTMPMLKSGEPECVKYERFNQG